ncbi:MAG TPA: metallophosphoesterase [Thermoleophilaceae bacterium]|nr:metallophosphoesterase [Thermoleophilaceae bacterium]
MRTALISDLHLGAVRGADVARRPDALERLAEAVAPADRIVLLGDLLEMRERPVANLLDVTRPFFDRLAEAAAGKRVTLVGGNHDQALVEPWLARERLAGRQLAAENEWPVEAGVRDGVAGWIASRLPEAELSVAYPGLRLRPDVYATHGHYLDLHLTVPRLESLAASAMARVTGRGSDCRSVADYEAVLAPLYGFYAGLAQGASSATLERGGTMSRSVWGLATGDGAAARILLGRIAIPGAVAALNRLGLGPFKPELTGEELRRAGLLAMGRVAETLAPGAEHLLFAHTHRPGPLAGDEEAEWTTLSGTRLWNTGSWFIEPTFISQRAERSPYWPGTVVWVDEAGPPRIENALRGYAVASV